MKKSASNNKWKHILQKREAIKLPFFCMYDNYIVTVRNAATMFRRIIVIGINKYEPSYVYNR